MMPKWLQEAYGCRGIKEVKGSKHNPLIVKMWASIQQRIFDDEAPWCAAFVGHCLEISGIRSSRKANARSYMQWGNECPPALGAIAVFWRGNPKGWQGHVGFICGRDNYGNLLILGGNQGDEVNFRPFPQSRLLGCRWPSKQKPPAKVGYVNLPLYNTDGKVSQNEQ